MRVICRGNAAACNTCLQVCAEATVACEGWRDATLLTCALNHKVVKALLSGQFADLLKQVLAQCAADAPVLQHTRQSLQSVSAALLTLQA